MEGLDEIRRGNRTRRVKTARGLFDERGEGRVPCRGPRAKRRSRGASHRRERDRHPRPHGPFHCFQIASYSFTPSSQLCFHASKSAYFFSTGAAMPSLLASSFHSFIFLGRSGGNPSNRYAFEIPSQTSVKTFFGSLPL